MLSPDRCLTKTKNVVYTRKKNRGFCIRIKKERKCTCTNYYFNWRNEKKNNSKKKKGLSMMTIVVGGIL